MELWKRTIFIEKQKDSGSPPNPDAELLSSMSGQLGFEARRTAIPGTKYAERDIEVDEGYRSTFRDTLWPIPITQCQSPSKLSPEIEDAQQMNDIFGDNDLAQLPV